MNYCENYYLEKMIIEFFQTIILMVYFGSTFCRNVPVKLLLGINDFDKVTQ